MGLDPFGRLAYFIDTNHLRHITGSADDMVSLKEMRTSVAALIVALSMSACSGETAGPNQRPVARAGPDMVIPAGETAELDGNHSYDPDGGDLDFFWELTARPAGSRAGMTALPDNGTCPGCP